MDAYLIAFPPKEKVLQIAKRKETLCNDLSHASHLMK